MKICPKCTRSYAEGFDFCPNDRTELITYDLRSDLRKQNDLQFILPTTSLHERLKKELRDAWQELRHNPANYIRETFKGEKNTKRRKKLIQTGLATGVIVYASIFVGVMLFKSIDSSRAGDVIESSNPIFPDMLSVITKVETRQPARKKGKGSLGGSERDSKISKGGGSHDDDTPAGRGLMATPSLQSQINPPDLSRILTKPTLIVQETIYVDPAYLKLRSTELGVPDAPPAPSLGDKGGTGIGPGKGPGYGKGEDGNVGDGNNSPGGGEPTGLGKDRGGIATNMRPTILFKQKAPYTEEARQNAVQGVVTLNVLFGADGVIKDVRVVHALPHGLTQSALAAAHKIRFQPAIKDGKPFSVRINIEYRFNLY